MNTDSTEQPRQISEETNCEDSARKVQLFRAGPSQYGVFEDEVATIAEWRRPTPLPHAPESVLGIVSIQGRMLTVLDLAFLAGNESVPADASYRYLIALTGDEQLALAASEINGAVEHSPPASDSATPVDERLFLEVWSRAGSLTKILNLAELFPAALRGRERRRRRF